MRSPVWNSRATTRSPSTIADTQHGPVATTATVTRSAGSGDGCRGADSTRPGPAWRPDGRPGAGRRDGLARTRPAPTGGGGGRRGDAGGRRRARRCRRLGRGAALREPARGAGRFGAAAATVPRYTSPATTGTLITISRTKVAAVCWLLSCSSSSSCCSAAACAGASPPASGNCATNRSIVWSGSRPTSSAYDRTKARLKMPPGSREISLRSSASSAATEILVVLAICRSETPRFSRAALSMLPKSPEPRSAAVVTACVANVRKRIPGCQTRRARHPRRQRSGRARQPSRSADGDMKRPIAAAPAAPARAASAARSSVTPPIASTGTSTAAAIRARPSSPGVRRSAPTASTSSARPCRPRGSRRWAAAATASASV